MVTDAAHGSSGNQCQIPTLILGGRLLHEQTPPWSAFLEKTTLICDLTVRFILQIHEVIGQSS